MGLQVVRGPDILCRCLGRGLGVLHWTAVCLGLWRLRVSLSGHKPKALS